MVRIGLEVCLDSPPPILQSSRFGLLVNQASVDSNFDDAHRLLAKKLPGQLKALFAPQHGLWGEQQDNMAESAHGRDSTLDVPIYSLYSDTRRPLPEMLEGLQLLVVDLQDVGTRVYTFIWTISHCLEACAEAGIPVLILDRPNPLGGEVVEGPLLNPDFASFVGRAPIPMRHGLTIGELTRTVNDMLEIGAEVHCVPMVDWIRSMHMTDTGRDWVLTSPNLPRLQGVDLYPGQVLLEGTNLSEGRGTTTPFEICGAPFVEPEVLIAELNDLFVLPGVKLRPINFIPTFQKHAGQRCGGVFLHVRDPRNFRPYRTSVSILTCIERLWPDQFAWISPPYEYEYDKMPIDILSGGSTLRTSISSGSVTDCATLDQVTHVDSESWFGQVADSLLY